MLAAQLDPLRLEEQLCKDAGLDPAQAAEAHHQALDDLFVYQHHQTHGANTVRQQLALHRLNQFIDRRVPVHEALKRPGRPVREVNPFSAFVANYWPSVGAKTLIGLIGRYMDAGYISFRDEKIVTSWGTDVQTFSEVGDILSLAVGSRKPDLILGLFTLGITFDNVPVKDHVFVRRHSKRLVEAGDACALVEFFHGDDDSPISLYPQLHALAMEAQMRRVITNTAPTVQEGVQPAKSPRRRAGV